MADVTSVTITPEQAAAAAAAAAAKPAENRPAWLDEKFKTPEELAAAYKELSAKLGTQSPDPKSGAATVPATTPEVPAGIDMVAIANEYNANGGKLSAETLKTLTAKGIPESAVSVYITGLQAQVQNDRSQLAAVVGTDEDLQTLYAWAAINLTPQELAGYNALVAGPGRNIDAAKLVLETMIGKYNAALGTEPSRPVRGNLAAPSSSGVQPYADSYELTKDMGSPEYKNSEAFRQKVAARLAVTRMFGL